MKVVVPTLSGYTQQILERNHSLRLPGNALMGVNFCRATLLWNASIWDVPIVAELEVAANLLQVRRFGAAKFVLRIRTVTSILRHHALVAVKERQLASGRYPLLNASAILDSSSKELPARVAVKERQLASERHPLLNAPAVLGSSSKELPVRVAVKERQLASERHPPLTASAIVGISSKDLLVRVAEKE